MDTTASGGRLIVHVFGALAEFERAVMRERMGSRPRRMDATQVATAKAMLADPDTPVRTVDEALHVSRATLYRSLSAAQAASGERPAPRTRSRTVPRRPRTSPSA